MDLRNAGIREGTPLRPCRSCLIHPHTARRVKRGKRVSLPADIGRARTFDLHAIGAALVCLGGYIRVLCFRHLGKQFTFQLSIRKDHRLITDGPYSIVRHPSNAGAVLQVIGMVICLGGSGAWFKEIGIHTTAGKLVGVFVGLLMAISSYGGIARTFKEDVVLRNTFGDEWEEWAKRTPYRLFPYIF